MYAEAIKQRHKIWVINPETLVKKSFLNPHITTSMIKYVALVFLLSVGAEELVSEVNNATRVNRQEPEPELTLITFLQKAVKSYGQKKVARSIYELAQKDLYDLIWMLAGELDTYYIFDLYHVYSASQTDPEVINIYERFRAGNVSREIVPEVFALDKKYDAYDWWKRVRGRMLASVDKYIAGELVVVNTPPPIEYGNGNVVIAGVVIPDSSATGKPATTTLSTDPFDSLVDSDEDILDILNF